MLQLDSVGNQVHLSITSKLDREEFISLQDYLKRINVYYDKKRNVYSTSLKRIDELSLWFEKDHIDYTATPQLIETYSEYAAKKYKKENKLLRFNSYDYSQLLNEGKTLFDYQIKGLNFLLSKNSALLADEQGLGKTLLQITWMSYLYKERNTDGFILVVKNGLSYHYLFELLEFSNQFKEHDVFIVNNENKEFIFSSAIGKKIIIVPNHLLADCLYHAVKRKKKIKKSNLHWENYRVDIKHLWNKNSMALIVDESHEFSNPDALKFESLDEHTDQFDYKLPASATPNIVAFEDIYTQMRIIDKGLFPLSYKAFLLTIADKIGTKYSPYTITKYNSQKIKEFKEYTKNFIIKRVKSDIPGFEYKLLNRPRYFSLHPDQKLLYNEIRKKELLIVKEHIQTKKIKSVNLKNIRQNFPYAWQALEDPHMLKDKLTDPELVSVLKQWSYDKDTRIVYLDELCKDIIDRQDSKLIIFDNHALTLDNLKERYKKYEPLIVHGSLDLNGEDKDRYREEVARQFNKNKNNKIFLASVHTSSAGKSYNEATNYTVFFNPPLSSLKYAQGTQRTHRVVSTRDSIVENLVFPKTFHFIQYRVNMQDNKFNQLYLTRDIPVEEIEFLLNGEV